MNDIKGYLHMAHLQDSPSYTASLIFRLDIFGHDLVWAGRAFHSLGPSYLRDLRP